MIATSDLYAAFVVHTKGETCFTRRMAIDMADFFEVSPRFIAKRLECLWILREGSWDWFVENGGIAPSHVEQVRSELHKDGNMKEKDNVGSR